MYFIIYNKAAQTVVQIRSDQSTGNQIPLSTWLQRHCELCELNLSEYAIAEIAKPSANIIPGKYKYIESTQQFQEDPNWVPPVETIRPDIQPM